MGFFLSSESQQLSRVSTWSFGAALFQLCRKSALQSFSDFSTVGKRGVAGLEVWRHSLVLANGGLSGVQDTFTI